MLSHPRPPLPPLLLAAVLAASAAPPAAADALTTLGDFEARLPEEVGPMRRVRPPGVSDSPGRVTAFYAGPTGRGTVEVRPAAPGTSAEAQLDDAVRDAVQQDQRGGAPILGGNPWTSAPEGQRMSLRDGPTLVCGVLERRQGGESGPPDQLRLLSRRCVAAVEGWLVGIFVATPFHSGQREAADRAQAEFVGGAARRMGPPTKG